jgi:hypothetical protein
MSVQMVIELPDRQGVQAVVQALETYKARLRAGVEQTRHRLSEFEGHYGVSTEYFLGQMAAEDLSGGDLEYVEWAGEAQLLKGLESELKRAGECPLPTFLRKSVSSMSLRAKRSNLLSGNEIASSPSALLAMTSIPSLTNARQD